MLNPVWLKSLVHGLGDVYKRQQLFQGDAQGHRRIQLADFQHAALLQPDPEHLALVRGIARSDGRVAIEQHRITVVTHGRHREKPGNQRRHAADVRQEQRVARLQVALWALRQRRLDQLRAVHVPRHQQDPGGVVQRVRLFELVLQRPGLQGGALLHGQRQAGQQHAQQNPMQSFHACPSRVENTWMSLRRSQSDWARQNACASSAASRTKTWDLPIPSLARRASTSSSIRRASPSPR